MVFPFFKIERLTVEMPTNFDNYLSCIFSCANTTSNFYKKHITKEWEVAHFKLTEIQYNTTSVFLGFSGELS